MGYIILKATKDEDLYVNWSTYVDAPVAWGTEEELADEDLTPERFERARRTGTSSHIGVGSWDSPIIISEMGSTSDQWLLPRDRLKDLLERLEQSGSEYDPEYDQQVLLDLAKCIDHDD